MSLASGKDFHSRARKYRAATRPSWLALSLPALKPWVTALLYHSLSYVLLAAAWAPESRKMRA